MPAQAVPRHIEVIMIKTKRGGLIVIDDDTLAVDGEEGTYHVPEAVCLYEGMSDKVGHDCACIGELYLSSLHKLLVNGKTGNRTRYLMADGRTDLYTTYIEQAVNKGVVVIATRYCVSGEGTLYKDAGNPKILWKPSTSMLVPMAHIIIKRKPPPPGHPRGVGLVLQDSYRAAAPIIEIEEVTAEQVKADILFAAAYGIARHPAGEPIKMLNNFYKYKQFMLSKDPTKKGKHCTGPLDTAPYNVSFAPPTDTQRIVKEIAAHNLETQGQIIGTFETWYRKDTIQCMFTPTD